MRVSIVLIQLECPCGWKCDLDKILSLGAIVGSLDPHVIALSHIHMKSSPRRNYGAISDKKHPHCTRSRPSLDLRRITIQQQLSSEFSRWCNGQSIHSNTRNSIRKCQDPLIILFVDQSFDLEIIECIDAPCEIPISRWWAKSVSELLHRS